MAEEKHHHHKEEEKEAIEAMNYSETTYRFDNDPNQYYGNTEAMSYAVAEERDEYENEEKHHKRKEHLGEMEAMAASAFALYEKHERKKDPENEHRHKIEEEIAAVAAIGGSGYAFHEHHEKKEAKEEEKRAEGKKKHHHIF